MPVPGAVALINALIISGRDTGRFTFEGFLSVNKKSRNDHLASLSDEKRTMIFYEAPHKLKKTLADMHSVFGNREISIVRELTKLHEECMSTTLEEAIAYYEDNFPKGEYVLVVAGKFHFIAPFPYRITLSASFRVERSGIEKSTHY